MVSLLNLLLRNLIEPEVMENYHVPHLPVSSLLQNGLIRSWRPADEKSVDTVNQTSQFKVILDVQQFMPQELKVKVVDGSIVVEGNHEEREDSHGYISRQFTRRYNAPENVNLDLLTSKLSSDGILTLEAPLKLGSEEKEGIEVPIRRNPSLSPSIKQADKKQKLDTTKEQ